MQKELQMLLIFLYTGIYLILIIIHFIVSESGDDLIGRFQQIDLCNKKSEEGMTSLLGEREIVVAS